MASLADVLKGQKTGSTLQDVLKGAKGGGNVASVPDAPVSATAPSPAAATPEAGSSFDGSESGVGRYLDLIGEGVLRGGINVAGLPASADEWLQGQAKQKLPAWLSNALTFPGNHGLHDVLPDLTDTNKFTSDLEAAHGARIKPPQNMGERFASAAGQGMGGSIVGGVGTMGPGTALTSGAAGGLAAQTATEIDPNSTVAPIAAALIAGGVPSGGIKAAGGRIAATPAGKLVEEILSPTSVDASSRAAEASIRGALGTAARDTAVSAEQLVPLRTKISSLPDADRLNLVQYMETRSSGQAPTIPRELQPVADAARDAYQLRETKLSNLADYAQRQFIEDYYPHMWEDPKKAQQFIQGWGGGKEGSGRNLKQRSIPTLADGIAAGLKPVSTDPIQQTLDYVANMDRFIATKQVFEEGANKGLIKVLPAGARPPQDWVKLNTFVGKKGPGTEAWAPAGFARVYNNFMSKGFHGNESAGKVYDALQRVNGGVNALQLGLSAFHLSTMAQESIVNGVAKGISEAFSGMPVKGAVSLAKAPAGPVRLAFNGSKLLREYLRPNTSNDPVMREIANLGEKANMNIATITKDLRASGAGSYWNAIKRGTLRMELASDFKGMRNAPVSGTAHAFFKNMGRTLDTVAQPLFEKYIPRLKAGAFYDNMRSWLEANPNATTEEKIAAARQQWDAIDNRFGELNHDNLFWNKTLKQAARLALRSYSWKLGTAREVGGGVASLLRDPKSLSMRSGEYSPAAGYAIALPLTYGALMAVYQKIKTGQDPQDLQDLVAARTGGTDASTQKPERVELPSYMKDVFGWARDASTYPGQGFVPESVTTSLSPLLTTAKELATNRDWKDQPIADPNADAPTWVTQWLQHIADGYLPISVQQAQQGLKKGSKITPAEQLLNVRPASRFLTDPSGYQKMMQGIGRSQWKKKQKTDKRQQSQYGGIE